MGCCCRLFCLSIFVLGIAALFALLPGLPPISEFSEFSVPPIQKLEGPLELNNVLDNAEKLYENKLIGPEHLLEHNGELYTTIHGGQVVKLVDGNVVHITQIGKPCKGQYQESICGRPLGMQFNNQGELIVADAYYGVWKVNVKTGQKSQIFSLEKEINGRKPKLSNSVAVAKNGDIYWTDSSTDFDLQNGFYTLLMNPSGRLIHYSASTRQNKVLLDGIWFANGIVLSPNEDFLVIAETSAARLIKHHLKGKKAGQSELFAAGLPGLPDNLTPLDDGILVPLVVAVDESHPLLPHSVTSFPTLRKILVRSLTVVEMSFDYMQQIYPNDYVEMAKYYLGNFLMGSPLYPKRVTIVHMDWNGRILGSMHGQDGKISAISHALPHKGYLYLGSPFNHYLARVPMPEVLGKKNEYVLDGDAAAKVRVQPDASKPKPTEAPKPKPTEAPKPKPTEAPKPKPTQAPKPTEAPKPIPTEAPKPKTTEAPKPKPTEAPKPKPTEAPKPKPTEKPKPKPTEAPKPKPTVAPKAKPTTEKPRETRKEPAPIVEKVQDVDPPKQEKLKVIKKGVGAGEL